MSNIIINEQYIAGILDAKGGFYIVKKQNRRYLYFKIGIENQPVYFFLKNQLKIDVRQWGNMYYITSNKSMKKLVEFLRNNCQRKDFEKMLTDNKIVFSDGV